MNAPLPESERLALVKRLGQASIMSLSLDDPAHRRNVYSILGSIASTSHMLWKKSRRQLQSHKLALQTKKYLIIGLCTMNAVLLVLTLQKGHTARLNDLHSVQALVAPTVLAQEVSIQPVKAPVAVEARVSTEKVVMPAKAVEAVSVVRTSYVPNRGNWDGLLQHYFGEVWQQAKSVMMCESGGNASAYNPSGATGLMQIMALPGRPSVSWLMVPENNIAYAAQLYRSSGWHPWVCKPK
jgi:hypothetical protein